MFLSKLLFQELEFLQREDERKKEIDDLHDQLEEKKDMIRRLQRQIQVRADINNQAKFESSLGSKLHNTFLFAICCMQVNKV